jgi:hypothetical protein
MSSPESPPTPSSSAGGERPAAPAASPPPAAGTPVTAQVNAYGQPDPDGWARQDQAETAAYIAAVARRNVIWMAISGILLGYVSLFHPRAEAPELAAVMPAMRIAFPVLVAAAFVLMVGRKWVVVMAFLVAAVGAPAWVGLGIYLAASGLDRLGGVGLGLLGGWWLYWAIMNGRVLKRLREDS